MRKKSALVLAGLRLGSNECSKSRRTLEAALGCPAGVFSSGLKTKRTGYPSRPHHPLLLGDRRQGLPQEGCHSPGGRRKCLMPGSWVKELLGTAAEGTAGVTTTLLCPSAAASIPHHPAPNRRAASEPSRLPQPTFKCHSLVIEPHVDCVIGLKEPLNLEGNWRRTKADLQVSPEAEKGGCEELRI